MTRHNFSKSRKSKIIAISLIIATLLFSGMYSLVLNVEQNSTLNTSRQSTVSPSAGLGNSVQSKQAIENNIGVLFKNWYKEHYNHNVSHLNTNVSKSLFKIFISQSQFVSQDLKYLSELEQSIFSQTTDGHVSFSMLKTEIENGEGTILKQTNSSVETSHGVNYENSTLFNVVINGVDYNVWKVNITSANGVVIDPWIWVNINYYVYHAPWYLGGWSLTYGENDNFNTQYSGSAASSIYNEWMKVSTIGGYADIVIGAASLFLKIPSVYAKALGLSLAAIGASLLFESSTMDSYWQATGHSYIHFDIVNDYYYPWVVTPLGSEASSSGLLGVLNSGGSYQFWYNVPYILTDGIAGVTISAYYSSISQQFVSDYGSGNWVWFS